MKSGKSLFFPVLPLGLLLIGCGAAEDEVFVPEVNPAVAFEGKPDEALAGTYKTKEGTVYVLEKGGNFHFDGKTSTPGGVRNTHGEGVWAKNGDLLLFKTSDSVVPYRCTLKGKDMKLALTGKMKNETLFVRQ